MRPIKLDRLLDPQRLNRFVYVRNNPLKYVDPDGMDITLAKKLKKKHQDRVFKNLVKLYQKESGREALKKMEASKVNYEMRVGKLPTVSNDGGTFENYGRFQLENPKGTVDGNGKVTSIEKDGLTVSITLDFDKFDQTQREILNGDRSVGELPSETDVVTHEYGHGDDFENDPVGNYNSEPSQNEKKANEFTEKLREEEDSMTKEDAEREVRKLLGI